MNAPLLRPVTSADHAAIAALLDAAFGGSDESRLADRLRRDGDVVLELAAVTRGEIAGHILFSRLRVADGAGGAFNAVALAPLAVSPAAQRTGLGRALVERAHVALIEAGETLSVVMGDPAYYGRFGYTVARASGFGSDYAGPYLQALAFGPAPEAGRLVYAPAFAGL